MSAQVEGDAGGWEPWPPDCDTLVGEIQSAWEKAGRPSGNHCGVQVQGDGESIRRYRVKLLNHERDTSTYPRNWRPDCPQFVTDIENEWKSERKPHGASCVVMIEGENPISGYKLVCHPSPS
jgi:hypothetical protein